MRIRDLYVLAAIAPLIYLKSVSGLPSLFSRQSCDSLWCPNLEDLWNTLGDGAARFLNGAKDLLQPAIAPTPYPQVPDSPPVTQPETEFSLDTSQPEQGDCNAWSPPVLESGINPQGNTNLHPCKKTTEQIIWPMSCDDTVQNIITEKILSGMDGQYKTSTDPLCRLKHGISFWLAKLTPEQIDALKEQTSAVRAITLNPLFEFGDLKRSSAVTKRTKVSPTDKRISRKKRVPLTVIKQETADPSLSFLSTPMDKPNSDFKYSYFLQAGRGVRVYVIDTGLDWNNENFDRTPLEWIYALDVLPVDTDPDGHGTCIASKIAGRIYGVAKKASITLVKTRPTVGSFIDALGKIISDLQRIEESGQETRGWAVVNISGGWADSSGGGDPTAMRMEEYIKSLAEDFQAVVVVSAGRDVDNDYGDINLWPPILSLKYDIITVGAVQSVDSPDYGRIFPWSRGGDALTVAAPGNGLCASLENQAYIWEGASFAGAVVSGLVAYFLSIPYLNNYFGSQPNLPAAVKGYVKQMTYRRFQAQTSVWNGLDSTDPETEYSQWQGLPFDPRL